MKKIIQIVSFLALVFVLAGTEVQAQSTTKIDADVPFDFAIGDQTFDAGKYVMRVRRVPSGADSIELRDAKNSVVYEAFALTNGDTGNGKAHFIFRRDGSVAQLSKIQTGSKGYTILDDGRDDVTLAAKKKKKSVETEN